MKRILIALFVIALLIGLASANAEESILGREFPDFSVTDTEGKNFTLSEALKDHEAVLINIWASWCPPCEAEFPLLNEVYEQFGEKIAFIALSCEAGDTVETIREYRETHGIGFPMARDENKTISGYIGGAGIPDTVIVDRFGKACFVQVGMFASADDLRRTIETFLGDGYTESRVLNGIPPESTTMAFPLSASRAIRVANGNVKKVLFRYASGSEPITAYVVNDDTAHVRLDISASDNPSGMVFFDDLTQEIRRLSELLDADRQIYTADISLKDESVCYVCLIDYDLLAATNDDPEGIDVYLLRDEETIQQFAEMVRGTFNEETTWEYADETEENPASGQAYLIHVTDQYGQPVSGVMMNFCTDTSCVMCETDGTGTASFNGNPDRYHVQLIEVPDGYGYDEDFEMYTPAIYGEWSLRIRKK